MSLYRVIAQLKCKGQSDEHPKYVFDKHISAGSEGRAREEAARMMATEACGTCHSTMELAGMLVYVEGDNRQF